jgi:hypothetical protein
MHMATHISGGNPSVQRRDSGSPQPTSSPSGGGRGHQKNLDHAGLGSLASRVGAPHHRAVDGAGPSSSGGRRSGDAESSRAPSPRSGSALLGKQFNDKKPLLEWPNGDHSLGKIHHTGDGPVFEIDNRWPDPRTQRKDFEENSRLGRVARALPVAPMADDSDHIQRFAVKLPTVLTDEDFNEQGDLLMRRESQLESGEIPAVSFEELAWVACVAGGTLAGLTPARENLLQELLIRSLDCIAPSCINPQSVNNVRRALAESAGFIELLGNRPPISPSGKTQAVEFSIRSNIEPQPFCSKLSALYEGQYLHFPAYVISSSSHAHALGI